MLMHLMNLSLKLAKTISCSTYFFWTFDVFSKESANWMNCELNEPHTRDDSLPLGSNPAYSKSSWHPRQKIRVLTHSWALSARLMRRCRLLLLATEPLRALAEATSSWSACAMVEPRRRRTKDGGASWVGRCSRPVGVEKMDVSWSKYGNNLYKLGYIQFICMYIYILVFFLISNNQNPGL